MLAKGEKLCLKYILAIGQLFFAFCLLLVDVSIHEAIINV